MITYHGISSDTLGLVVESFPSYNVPSKKVTAFEVAGRNGDILYSQNAYHNVIQSYDCYINGSTNLSQAIQGVINWLVNLEGYQRLEDSYTANQFRLAYCSNVNEVANALNRFGRCTIEFSCYPQRFLTSGETEITIVSPHTLTNPTPYDAKPLIYVNTSSVGKIDIDGIEIECAVGEYYIDCDSQNAYFGDTNMNTYISCPQFPTLGASSVVTLTSITTCKITPRWYVL